MKKLLLTTTKFTLVFVLLFLFYIIWVAGSGTYYDYQPVEEVGLNARKEAPLKVIEDSTLSFLIWNMGYGGLGKESDFFYDDGGFFSAGDKMVRGKEEWIKKNIQGANAFIAKTSADFYLLQEVDVESKRSYFNNQLEGYEKQRPNYASFFAPNYVVDRVPIPIFEPWQVYGKVNSGLGTLSRFQPKKSTRFQLPGTFEWPTRIFQLDRCLAVHRYIVKNGKELVVFNLHNSAYDSGGFLKKQQMKYLQKKVQKEYKKGNYVIVGGDWNQCPPDFKFDAFMPGQADDYVQTNIAKDYLPSDWQWVYDATIPTNRKTSSPYVTGKSFVTLIDFFLVSPNLTVNKVQGYDLGFDYSDHQPVRIEVELQ